MARKINNLLRFNKDQKWLCFDFETESLNLYGAKPWQLSYAIFNGDELENSFDCYPLWENLSMSADAARISGFNQEKYLSKAQDPEKILQEFEKHLYNKDILITGANLIGFDIFIHNLYRRLLGRQSDYSYIERVYDIQNIEKAIALNYQRKEGQSQAEWNFKLKSYRNKGLKVSVEALCKKYNVPYDRNKAHDALYDVFLTKQILNKQLYLINQ